MFEIQKSGDKTSSGEIGLDIRTHASPKMGQDQVSGGYLQIIEYMLKWRSIDINLTNTSVTKSIREF